MVTKYQSKLRLGYEEALWPTKLDKGHASHFDKQSSLRFRLFLSHQITIVFTIMKQVIF